MKDDKQTGNFSDDWEHRFRPLLEATPDAVLIVDEAGVIRICNTQAEEMMGYSKSELIGQPVEMLIPESKRLEHVELREQYNQDPYKRPMGAGLELFAERKDGTRFPVDIMLGPLQEKGQLNVIATIRDVSDFKESQDQLKREKAFTSLLKDITQLANQAQHAEQTLENSLRIICEFMDWPVGHVYLPADDGSGEFYPSDIWYLKEEETFSSFKKMTMCTRFTPGMGMVGNVIRSGKPQWFQNVHENTEFVRRMPETDLHVRACLGIPILVQEEVVGVLEFFTSELIPGNEPLMDKMATIGKQLGQAIERLRVNEMLSQSRTKFKALFDTSHDAIIIFDEESLVDCNERTIRLFQRSRNILSQSSVYSFLPEEQPDGRTSKIIAHQKMARAFAGEDQFFELQFERPDGSTFYAEVSLIPVQLNGRPHIQAVLRDITARKESERQLKKNMQLFRQLFKNSPGSVALLDQSKTVLKINDSFTKIFGYTPDEVKGKKITDFFVPDRHLNDATNIFAKTCGGESIRFESERVHKNGTVVPVVVDTAPVTINGDTIAVFYIYVDISEQKRIENELRKSLGEKEVLLKEIHHRVKNNLAIISGLLDLQIDHTDDEVSTAKLRESQSRIYSMALVHEQLYQMESFSALNLAEYIRELTHTIMSTFDLGSKEIQVDFQTHTEQPLELELDQAIPCGQLLNEILTNAFKHAFPEQEQGTITVSLNQENGSVQLTISDNGCGIPDAVISGDTSSLGLNLVQSLVMQLHGDIEISNQDGTTFTITFPTDE